MTIEMENPGVSGYSGFATRENSEQRDAAIQHEPAASDHQAPVEESMEQTSSAAHSGGHDDNGDDTSLQFNYEQVPGFEASASDCLNRARQIARSLNHLNLSSDHLMLALTMEPNARRLLERAGDIQALQEAAMCQLGKMHSRFSRSEEDRLAPTSDLVDIGKKARDAAAEREQLVAISDLIAAFPKANGRLTYGSGEISQARALTTTFEQNVVPRISEALNQMEALVRDAVTRQQSVQSMLQDLGVRNSDENDRRQRDFMDEVRSQVREAADLHIGAALADFTNKFDTVIAQVKEALKPAEMPQQTEPAIEQELVIEQELAVEKEPAVDEQSSFSPGSQIPSKPRGSTWNWLGLL